MGIPDDYTAVYISATLYFILQIGCRMHNKINVHQLMLNLRTAVSIIQWYY